jgi:hypothetical protein
VAIVEEGEKTHGRAIKLAESIGLEDLSGVRGGKAWTTDKIHSNKAHERAGTGEEGWKEKSSLVQADP